MQRILKVVPILMILWLTGCNKTEILENDNFHSTIENRRETVGSSSNSMYAENELQEENDSEQSEVIADNQLGDNRINELLKAEDILQEHIQEGRLISLRADKESIINLNGQMLDFKIMNSYFHFAYADSGDYGPYYIVYTYDLYINDSCATSRMTKYPLYEELFDVSFYTYYEYNPEIYLGNLKDTINGKEYLTISNDIEDVQRGMCIYDYQNDVLLEVAKIVDDSFIGTYIPNYNDNGEIINFDSTWSYLQSDDRIFYRDAETSFECIDSMSLFQENYLMDREKGLMATHEITVSNGVFYDRIIKLYDNYPHGQVF